jgi:hypothetical protein
LKFGKVDDAKIPGDLLGTYSVEGTLTESNCGEGLGSPSDWKFDVKLSRFHDDLYWLNGHEVIPGSIDPDGTSFAFDTRVEAQATPEGRGHDACVLNRADRARGTLSSDDLDVESFEATLSFTYTPTEGSDCETLIGTEGGLDALPCSLSYDLSGKRRGEAPSMTAEAPSESDE